MFDRILQSLKHHLTCISKATVSMGQQETMQLRDACSQCRSVAAGVWRSQMIISFVSGCEDVLMLCHVLSQVYSGNSPNMSANKLQRSSRRALTHNARASRTSCSRATCSEQKNSVAAALHIARVHLMHRCGICLDLQISKRPDFKSRSIPLLVGSPRALF